MTWATSCLMDIELLDRPSSGRTLNSMATTRHLKWAHLTLKLRLCKSQMAPIWKFLCERVTTKDKAKVLRSLMEDRCVTDTLVTWSPLLTRRGTTETYRQRQPMKAKGFEVWNLRLPLLKNNLGMLKQSLEVLRNGCRHPSSKLDDWVSLNTVFI